MIIDFKTHDSKEVAHDIRNSYDKQLNIYKEVWEEITGQPVVKTDVFFYTEESAGKLTCTDETLEWEVISVLIITRNSITPQHEHRVIFMEPVKNPNH